MKMKRWLSLLCALVLLCSIAGCGNQEPALSNGQTGAPDTTDLTLFESEQPESYVPVSTRGNRVLAYCADTGSIRIEDTAGTVLWNSAVTPDVYDTAMASDSFAAYMASLLSISYSKKEDTTGSFITSHSSQMMNDIVTYRLDNGLRVAVDFFEAGISIALDITLTDEGLSLCIPQNTIREEGDFLLYAVEVLPFFGAAASTDEGYLFYPDGSGCLSYFNRTGEKNKYTPALELDVYSPLDDQRQFEQVPSVMLPVFGVRRNGQAFLACADQGDELLTIHVAPSTSMALLPVNRAYFRFTYRNRYRMYTSNSVRVNQDRDTLQYRMRLSSTMEQGDRQMSILLLDDESADYSGMAVAYRNHLRTAGKLPHATPQTDLSLDIFMAVDDPDALFGGYAVATDFDRAAALINSYLSDGVDSLQVRLQGWSSDGGNLPQKATPTGSIGGKKGLSALSQLATDNQKLQLRLQANGTLAPSSYSAALMGNTIPISDRYEATFLYSPDTVASRLEKFDALTRKYPGLSLAVEQLGSRIYSDYKSSARMGRRDTIATWQSALSEMEKPAVTGGNLYALTTADFLYSIPLSGSGSALTDEAVPFYQMVVHGSIGYTGDQAGNLSADLNQTVLQWMEYGCVPHFTLTDSNPSLLTGTAAADLFSSEDSQWHNRVLEVYKKYATAAATLADKAMVSHRRVSDTLSVTTYEGGAQVIVNYGDTAATWQGTEVPATDYVVIGGMA